METRNLGSTGLKIAPLVLGGNVFGWTADRKTSFAILDAFLDHGFNAIDTADVYTAWVPGNKGGESESIIGQWLKARPSARNKVVIFTKVGSATDGKPKKGGLSRDWILQAVDGSLGRLGIDAIDVYFAHWPDETSPLSETLEAFETLTRAGKIKFCGASNLTISQFNIALKIAKEKHLPFYKVIQPEYNLYDRDGFEGEFSNLCQSNSIGVVTYYSLASGFLSGKYRRTDDFSKSVRGSRMGRYLTPRGLSILEALDAVAASQAATPAEIALAWLMTRAGVTAPIASATSVAQVASFARSAEIRLSEEEKNALTAAGRQ